MWLVNLVEVLVGAAIGGGATILAQGNASKSQSTLETRRFRLQRQDEIASARREAIVAFQQAGLKLKLSLMFDVLVPSRLISEDPETAVSMYHDIASRLAALAGASIEMKVHLDRPDYASLIAAGEELVQKLSTDATKMMQLLGELYSNLLTAKRLKNESEKYFASASAVFERYQSVDASLVHMVIDLQRQFHKDGVDHHARYLIELTKNGELVANILAYEKELTSAFDASWSRFLKLAAREVACNEFEAIEEVVGRSQYGSDQAAAHAPP